MSEMKKDVDSLFCEHCKEKDCLISLENTCEMIRKYLSHAEQAKKIESLQLVCDGRKAMGGAALRMATEQAKRIERLERNIEITINVLKCDDISSPTIIRLEELLSKPKEPEDDYPIKAAGESFAHLINSPEGKAMQDGFNGKESESQDKCNCPKDKVGMLPPINNYCPVHGDGCSNCEGSGYILLPCLTLYPQDGGLKKDCPKCNGTGIQEGKDK